MHGLPGLEKCVQMEKGSAITMTSSLLLHLMFKEKHNKCYACDMLQFILKMHIIADLFKTLDVWIQRTIVVGGESKQ